MLRRTLTLVMAVGLIVGLVGQPLPAAAEGPKVLQPDLDAPLEGLSTKPSKVAYIIEETAARVARARRAGESPAALSNPLLSVNHAGDLGLMLHGLGPITELQAREVEALGATVVDRLTNEMLTELDLPPFGLLVAWVPFDRIEAVAALPWIAAVTPASRAGSDPHPQNGVVSEGVAMHNADDVQTRGETGAGVNVGVISDGVQNLATAQANNELPAVTVLDAGSADEGTAMLEIVHDMAPGAGLIFDGGAANLTDYIGAFNALVAAGAHVVTEDLFWWAEPAFQQGLSVQTAENVASGGVPVHSSAGNRGTTHTGRVAAVGTGAGPDGGTGPFTGCNNPPDNVVAIAPGGDTTFDLTLAGGNGSFFSLQWSEPRAIAPTAGQGGFTDLNLYIMDATGTTCLGQSTATQANGSGDTIEQVAMGGAFGGTNVKVVVDVQGTSSAVAAPILDLRWNRATNTDTPTRAGSINPDSNYTGLATSAAAVNVTSGTLEPFSSAGPVQLVTTTQCPGGAPGPCTGVAGPATVTANGPNWTAADGNLVSGAGGFGSSCGSNICFFGTSAAAPHAAACDALVRDELGQPAAAPATTNAILTASSISLGNLVTEEGAGQLDCLAAINDPPTAVIGGPYATDEGTPIGLDASGSSDPDAGDTITYEWDLDNDGAFDDSTSPTPSFTKVGQDGSFTVSVRVTDTAGESDTESTTVEIDNVAPSLTFTASTPEDEGDSLALTGLATDPGWEDALSATVDWGDGGAAVPLSGMLENIAPNATLLLGSSHVYGDNGTFTIEVCVDDDDTSTCEQQDVVVNNVTPTAAIDKSGATLINGVETFLAHAGEPVNLSGNSTDPGSDDLTLTWDWDDGSPSPDVTTISLVNPPDPDPGISPTVQPRDVTDDQTNTFGDACTYDVTFASGDDDGDSADDLVKVIITGNAENNRGAGYWQHQYKGNGSIDFGTPQLECFLEIVGYMSTTFHEVRSANTIPKALDVLRTNGTSAASELLDRQLLAVWLNFSNGAMDLADLVDTNRDGIPDAALADALAQAETVRTNPLATRAQLLGQKNKMESINLMDE